MREFKGKVAVITGAASGIGRGMAERCATEGMKVVLSDVEEQELTRTAEALRAAGGDVTAVVTDVSKAEQVRHLSEVALDTYGAVHLLCNNAGVGAGGLVWEHTLADWEWVLGVNLWGVIHGIHTFLPTMLAQGTDCHIVNVASIEGLWSRIRGASYQVSKHGVVVLSEVLKLANAERIPIIVRGGGTGLSGGALASGAHALREEGRQRRGRA